MGRFRFESWMRRPKRKLCKGNAFEKDTKRRKEVNNAFLRQCTGQENMSRTGVSPVLRFSNKGASRTGCEDRNRTMTPRVNGLSRELVTLEIASSSLAGVAIWGIDAMVACLLCKQKVAGSNPVYSTIARRLRKPRSWQ